jgi:anti-sigma regulatory factor (Ser/Thr protein kinase)
MRSVHTWPGEPGSIAAARHFVAEALIGLSPELLDVLVLMVSELATNSVVHAASPFRVRVEQGARTVRIEVHDLDGGRIEIAHATPDDLHGRGLAIVDVLSDDWGVTRSAAESGKTVWFSLNLPAGLPVPA